MSRASDVRDAVAEAIKERLTDQTVETFLVPHYTREELDSGPRIIVRFGARELRVDQGPDERDIEIEVGTVGVTPERKDHEESVYRAAQVAACDGFDGLMESVIALWTPNGPLSRCGMAEHAFDSIDQAINFDATKLYNEGIWLSMIQLTYRDSQDESDE
ncbi:hypothetical protein K227x_62240 [Rubripirellula lacrimiformis]|uniref:Uncharacterized protein n=1 Tax=Rubripirellula lacrimiformis TaxID=1930273 RepID=A0A517NKZ3_9BACT|nr:hypothetical protein [Rubripirellula lacrimiformis]QDT07796.1 hypothetical protein K227x_62240 [Rubripirellula lacrimiformis]